MQGYTAFGNVAESGICNFVGTSTNDGILTLGGIHKLEIWA